MSQTPPLVEERKKFNLDPATLFLLIGFLVGTLYCIFIPYGAGFDEEQHVVRIFDIAAMNLLPNRSDPHGTPSYGDFLRLSYQRRYFQTPASDLLSKDIFFKPIDTSVTVAFPTRSIYPPVDFIPQSIIARLLWRKYNDPVVPVAILLRFSGFLLYLFGSYLAIRLLPFGKWVFLFLALAPMALFEAATLNADGFTNVISFMFIGLVLNIYHYQEKPVPAWKMVLLLGLILMLGLTKTGTVLVLPLLLILPFKQFKSKFYTWLIIFVSFASIGLMLWWNVISIPGSHFSDGGGQSLSQQMQYILANPLGFLRTYVIGNILAIGGYYRDWVGVYGYWSGIVPGIIYWLFPIGLISALMIDPHIINYSRKTRLIVAGTFVIAAAGIAFIFSYLHFDPDEVSILGRQGRYYIFAAPLLFLSLTGFGFFQTQSEKWAKGLTLAVLVLVIGFYSLGIYTTYYTDCGSTLYTFQSCSQPVYKNLDVSASAPQAHLNAAAPITQGFTSVCGKIDLVSATVKSVPVAKSGILRFSLLNNNGQLIAVQEFPLSSLSRNLSLNLPVQPDQAQEGIKYTIKLETPDLISPDGVGIAISSPKQYRDGDYTMAGEKQPVDLVFHYSCINPWTGK